MTVTATSRSRVRLHELYMRVEDRDGQPEWVIGSRETGQFIAVPEVAVDVIRLLNAGRTVAEHGNGSCASRAVFLVGQPAPPLN